MIGKIKEKVNYYIDKCKEIADYLTENPEISGEEENACKYITSFLKERGYNLTTPYANMPNSFLAVNSERAGENVKKAAFLCEYDALPEIGHACGHSMSCATSILAGLVINDAFKDLPIRIDIIGTPAEECIGGKIIIGENGGFDGYEFVAMVHMYNEDITQFNVLASNDRYITFNGKSAHASAAPENGLNALNAARLFMDAMDMWRQHVPNDCQIHGIVVKGGDAPNIVPDKVVLDYYFRAASMEKLKMLNEKARICADGASIATGTTFEMEQRYPDYGELFCNAFKHDYIKELFQEVNRCAIIQEKAQGSSDAGNADFIVPVFHPMIDVTNHNKTILVHEKKFEELMHKESAYKALEDGAIILARLAYRMATEEDLMSRIKEDHKKYRCL